MLAPKTKAFWAADAITETARRTHTKFYVTTAAYLALTVAVTGCADETPPGLRTPAAPFQSAQNNWSNVATAPVVPDTSYITELPEPQELEPRQDGEDDQSSPPAPQSRRQDVAHDLATLGTGAAGVVAAQQMMPKPKPPVALTPAATDAEAEAAKKAAGRLFLRDAGGVIAPSVGEGAITRAAIGGVIGGAEALEGAELFEGLEWIFLLIGL